MAAHASSGGTDDASTSDAIAVDVTGDLIRVTPEDIQAGILLRLAFSDRDIVMSGVAGTLVIAGIFARVAPIWQVLPFVAARLAAAYGSHVLSRRVRLLGAPTAAQRGYLLILELWFAAIALSWSCAIFLAPSPMLSRPESVLGVVAIVAVEGVTVLTASVSRRIILFVVGAFWASLTLRALFDTGEGRTPFIVCIALYHMVLVMHAFNLQRQTVKTVRSEIVNRILLERVTQLHSRVRQNRDELARLNLQLQVALEQSNELASYDQLTNSLNRRAFLERIREQKAEMQRSGHPAAIVLIDLDRFKAINDTYGHAVGDRVLADCSTALQSQMRASDVFARWGGEEFIVLLPDTTVAEAAIIAERYRITLTHSATQDWPHGLCVSASFGVADLDGATSIHEAVSAADTALYRAKAEGRNMIRVAG
jgi:diguanylate cyclase (GGDEF)-like protein